MTERQRERHQRNAKRLLAQPMQKLHRFLLTGRKAGVPKNLGGTRSKRCAAQNAVKRKEKVYQRLP
jgi:hypothetical protein